MAASTQLVDLRVGDPEQFKRIVRRRCGRVGGEGLAGAGSGGKMKPQYSCCVGRNRISLMSTSSGWPIAYATARANEAGEIAIS